MAKKILIICRSYYPHYGPQAHRMANFAKYLAKFGYEPVVLCPNSTPDNERKYDPALVDHDVCRTIRVPYNISPTKRIFDFYVAGILKELSLEVLKMLSPRPLYHDMLACADSLLQKEKFDVILATTPSPLTLAIADKMSRKYRTQWIADFRDVPAQHIAKPNCFSPYQLYIKLHKNYCASASGLTTVSEPLRDKLNTWLNKPVFVVYNGFDPNNYQKNLQPKKDHFIIAYCGAIHTGRNPALLLDALDSILKNNAKKLDRFQLLIYGSAKHRFRRLFGNRPCSHLIQNKGHIPFFECIKAQQEASALLFLPSSHVQGMMTSKIFEYLGSRRPILSVPGDNGVTDALLEETQAGVVGKTADEISKILLNWIDKWQKNGSIEYKGIPNKIQRYTREKQTEHLAQFLEQVSKAST